MVRILARYAIVLLLLLLIAVLNGELVLITRDAPNAAYIWRRFGRVAIAHDYWLHWLLVGGALIAFTIAALNSLNRHVRAHRIVGGLTLVYWVSLLFQLIRFSVLSVSGVEPGYELALYTLLQLGSLLEDGGRAAREIPLALPLGFVLFSITGYLLHRYTRKRIKAHFGEKLSEDQRDSNALGLRRKVIPVVVGALALAMSRGVPVVHEKIRYGGDADVGTPTDLPNHRELKVRTWPYEDAYRKRYGYNLKKGTNIVIYMLESVRDGYLEPERSRYFKKMSELRRSRRFYVPVPHSSNSHWSLLTGRYSSHRALWRYGRVSPEATMPGVLGAAGYRNYYLTSGPAWYDGEDKMLRRLGMRIIQRKELDRGLNPRTGRRYRRFGWGLNDISMLDGLRRILREERGPFFMLHVFTNTHTPYWNPYPRRYNRFNGKTKLGAHRNGIDWTMDLVDRMTDEYKKKGLLENTIFIVLSDHGESFGEYGFRMHDFSLYNTELRIPFLMRHPDLRRWDDLKEFPAGSIMDVYPTLMDMLGLPYPEAIHGRSLFAPDYRLRLVLRSWGSDAYAGFLLGETKWIHGLRRRNLKRMSVDDGGIRVLSPGADTRRFVRALRKIEF